MTEYRKRPLSCLAAALIAAAMSTSFTGCAAIKAWNLPPKKSLVVLEPGMARSNVVSELGAPLLSREKEGERIDTFSFDKGIGGGAKFARVLFHCAADLFTLFLWEVVATPAEAMVSNQRVEVDVTYDQEEKVKQVAYLK